MSHYMEGAGYFFSKLIFVGLDESRIELVKKLKVEFHVVAHKRYWVFMKTTHELPYHLDQGSLVVASDEQSLEVARYATTQGHPFCVTWSFFLINIYSILRLEKIETNRKVCLGFISEEYSRLYRILFSLYGYETIVSGDLDKITETLQEGVSYLVFDLDMNSLGRKERYQFMQRVQGISRDGMQTSVIKNFDTGSLFNDIISPVKDVSNIILNPEEYYLFLRKYLYLKNMEYLDRELIREPQLINALSGDPGYPGGSKKSAGILGDLRDSKKTYNRIQSIPETVYGAARIEDYRAHHLRYDLSSGSSEVILRQATESQRELFTFFSANP